MGKKKSKIGKWFDDNVFYYIWTKPKGIWLDLRHWFECNFNIYHFRFVKEAWCAHPWDGGFILKVEERFLDKQLHWFENHQRMVDEQYQQILRTLRWARHCVHAMNNECDYFHYDGDVNWIPQEKNAEGKLVDRNPPEGEAELYRMDMSNMHYFYDGPRVNRRNAYRFMNKETVESEHFKSGHMDHDYYLAKCKHLYYLIRERYTDIWWD